MAEEPERGPVAWKAGVSRAVITPGTSMWMAGYAARNKPSEGTIHDLWAKALALQDSQGQRLVIVSMDLIGVPRELRDAVVQQAKTRWDLPPQCLMLCVSHTHCGPELRMSKTTGLDLDPERIAQTHTYCEDLQETVLQLIDEAIGRLAPAGLQYTHARAGFAMNRRLPTERGVQNRPFPDGPVDHDVPVLKVADPTGKLVAVLFGYACHNTTLSFYNFCGDYAGFAQSFLEEAHPGVTAMFVAGCGADQNPQPRGTVELCGQHGRALANGVEAALISTARTLDGPLRMAITEIPLEYAAPPARSDLKKWAASENQWDRRRGKVLLQQLESEGQLDSSYPYLIQVVRFGEDLAFVALAGEVVVDYALRLKQELHFPAVWVAAYTNDVFGYVPAARMLKEGGYEPVDAIRYSTHPAPFKPQLEQDIVTTVHELAGK